MLLRIRNILFCIAFFILNKLDNNIVINNIDKFKPVIGRGLVFKKKINGIKVKFIDETYNANPDTMKQSIEYFNFLDSKNFDKILILGNMNELGKNTPKFHIEILKFVENFKFTYVILCGKFLQSAIKKIDKPFNEFIILNNENDILNYISDNLHKNAIILAKCSNSTSVNTFGSKFIKAKGNK